MILWTIMPPEAVFPEANPEHGYKQMRYLGCNIFAEELSVSKYRLVRLLSTDPADYLRPELQPGRILTKRS
ncbi:MAG: YlzJ-like family protein [Sporomusaceae bacterium]|nr:YlzJ-like family protein [Sporomusaceae bacterium]